MDLIVLQDDDEVDSGTMMAKDGTLKPPASDTGRYSFILSLYLRTLKVIVIPTAPDLIILREGVSYHTIKPGNNQLAIASGFITMPVHIATLRGNQALTLNEYPSLTKSMNHGPRA